MLETLQTSQIQNQNWQQETNTKKIRWVRPMDWILPSKEIKINYFTYYKIK